MVELSTFFLAKDYRLRDYFTSTTSQALPKKDMIN